MKSKAELFFENLKGKKVAFIGAGVSHKQLIEIFSKEGAIVTLCDKKTLEGFGEYGQTLKELGVNLSLGENYLEGLKNLNMNYSVQKLLFRYAVCSALLDSYYNNQERRERR